MNRWRELLAALGKAVLDEVAAELASLVEDLKRSARGLGVSMGIFAAAAVAAFFGVALVISAVVALVSLHLPTWAAALVVGGGLLLLAAALALWARATLRRLETPEETLSRHWQERQAWWGTRIVSAPSATSTGGEDEREN